MTVQKSSASDETLAAACDDDDGDGDDNGVGDAEIASGPTAPEVP